MSKRLQVVMDDAEYDEIQQAADARRLTVSAWVRQTLRAARAAPEGTPSGGAPLPAALGGIAPDPELIRAVMVRHGIATPGEAVAFALRQAAEPPLSRRDLLGLRGSGWSGDLETLRGTDRTDP